MIRHSRQRDAILQNLQGRRDHPTAEMVYASVRTEYPNISLGTVYRNLAMLSENGNIVKISTGIGPDRFDGFIQPHNHFICKCCGRVMDMNYQPTEKITEEAAKEIDGQIDSYELQFFGKCSHCRA